MRRRSRNVANLTVTPELLIRALQLDGVEVLSTYYDFDRDWIMCRLQNDNFNECEEGEVPDDAILKYERKKDGTVRLIGIKNGNKFIDAETLRGERSTNE